MIAYKLFLPLARMADIERSHFGVAIVADMSSLFASLTHYVVLCPGRVVGFVAGYDNWVLPCSHFVLLVIFYCDWVPF